MAHDKQNRDAILKRLSRLNGQVQGVSRMVEDGRYCVDILNQTAAIRSALRAVARKHAGVDVAAAHAVDGAGEVAEFFDERCGNAHDIAFHESEGTPGGCANF